MTRARMIESLAVMIIRISGERMNIVNDQCQSKKKLCDLMGGRLMFPNEIAENEVRSLSRGSYSWRRCLYNGQRPILAMEKQMLDWSKREPVCREQYWKRHQ